MVSASLLVAAVLGVAWLAVGELGDARGDLDARYEGRADVAASFIDSVVEDIFDRETAAAELELATLAPTANDLRRAAYGQRMNAAVLLDDTGRALAAYPSDARIVGDDLSSQYAHLAGALGGRLTVSGVVPSASRGLPVVAFALPFDTPFGMRVFSGALDVRDTPLRDFLENASALSGHRGYLIDWDQQIVASSTGVVGPLGDVEPVLATQITRELEGGFEQDGADHRYVVRLIDETPWRLVMAVPAAELYAPLQGVRRATAIVVAALAFMTLWVVRLLAAVTGRARQLARTAATDPLTGAGNRRRLQEWAHEVDPATKVGALVVDIDHFKRINDTWGHGIGDEVLRAIADRLLGGIREGDVVVRWGGEEFAVVLVGADGDVARRTAERLRRAIATPVRTSAGSVKLTASIGIAVGTAGRLDAVMGEADAALYAAKRAGRNRVVDLTTVTPERVPV